MNRMYENVGKGIMLLAKVIGFILFWGGIVTGVILFFAFIEYMPWVGLLVAVSGVISSFFTMPLYGFGQLVENSDILVAEKTGGKVETRTSNKDNSEKIETLNKWKEQGLITEEEYQQKMEALK